MICKDAAWLVVGLVLAFCCGLLYLFLSFVIPLSFLICNSSSAQLNLWLTHGGVQWVHHPYA